MQAKVIESLPIADIQILRVGKKIINSDKVFNGDLISFVSVLIFEAKKRDPIFPKKVNINVMEKILRWRNPLKNLVIERIKSVLVNVKVSSFKALKK